MKNLSMNIRKIPLPLISLCVFFTIIPNFLDDLDTFFIDEMAWFALLFPCFIFSYYLGLHGGVFTGIIVNTYHLSWFFYEKKFHSENMMDESAAMHIGISLITLSCSVGVGTLAEKLQNKRMKIQELNEQLIRMALYDSLTGLPNRHYFIRELEKAIKRKDQLYLMFIDLDGFKRVNDQYGHDTGDKLLIEVSQKLLEIEDKDTFVGRLGGDEFTVLLKGANLHQAKAQANRILNLLQISIYDCKISASIGVAMCHPEETPASILKIADLAMYKAKLAGKNTVNLVPVME
ncbi:GGDEF domain-containing protein [Neobacillus sp. 114]|uniref:GGDEF domain-containing protein n=1 Tax=Neobacillus sp. 114 TaxID=3048535 RepID=UPI0024C36ED6|nr:GGDEF domain-containing protein [Neobacillus sp. 114]